MTKANRNHTAPLIYPPILPAPQFQIFDHVPMGCELQFVEEGSGDPHLRVGDFVVVDVNDKQFVSGEIYRIRYPSSGRCVICYVRKRPFPGLVGGSEGIMAISFTPIAQRLTPDGAIDWSRLQYTSDGPLDPQYLGRYLAGRVIGVYEGVEPIGHKVAAPWGARP